MVFCIKTKIVLELHKEPENNCCVLNEQDVYQYIGESTSQEIELAMYIQKWCEFLNYSVLNSNEMVFGDPEYAKLEGWISGYNFAKHIEVEETDELVTIKMNKYEVILSKPFEF